jgi:flavodoxin I
MADLNLEGKPVAVFGLGDSVSYAENYCDGMGELHDVFAGLGCKMLGYVSVEGYEHEESKSQRGDVFCGLALDAVNFEELTEGRVESWIEQLKEEGILEATGSAFMGSSAPTAAVALTTEAVSIEDDIVAQLQRENAELRRQLQESSGTKSASFGNNRFSPHYNSVTGRTMWTSADGRSCYFTQGSP